MIKVSAAIKRFGKIKALDGLDLNVNSGSIYGLVGTNGAGKTTIIKAIVGIQRLDEGTVTIDGEEVYENPSVKSRIGYVSDDSSFLPGYSMADMGAYLRGIYPEWDTERYNLMIEEFGLDPKMKLSSFSKGMQKQAALIMALSSLPDILVLDEPIDGLDPVVRLKAWKYIIDDVAERGTTVLVSSHNLREMEGYCDHIGIISEGRMVIERDLEDLKTDVHKVQVAFAGHDGEQADRYEDLNILHREKRGSVDLLIVKDRRENIEEIIGAMEPAVFDMLPLSLEEIFIYELGGVSNEIDKVI